MGKSTFDILVKLLLQNDSHYKTIWQVGKKPIDPVKKTLVALLYMASQQTIRQIGDKFNISDSTVFKCRNDFLRVVSSLHSQIIKWPYSEEEQMLVSQQFESLANFKGNIASYFEIKRS